jgi:hypothetical protein
MAKRKKRRGYASAVPERPSTLAPATSFAVNTLVLSAAVVFLYWSALRYPLVFDDFQLSEYALSTHYSHAVSWFAPRWLSDASFGWIYGAFGKAIFSQRLANLLLHATTGLVLYGFLSRLFGAVLGAAHSRWLALFGAAMFVLHPVAVYAVAYLIQRSIILATLFSLLPLVSRGGGGVLPCGVLEGGCCHATRGRGCDGPAGARAVTRAGAARGLADRAIRRHRGDSRLELEPRIGHALRALRRRHRRLFRRRTR